MDEQILQAHLERLKRERDTGMGLLQAAYELQVKALEIVRGHGLGIDLTALLAGNAPAANRVAPPPVADPRTGEPLAPPAKSSRARLHARQSARPKQGKKRGWGVLQRQLEKTLGTIEGEFTLGALLNSLPPGTDRDSVRAAVNRLAKKGSMLQRVREGTPTEGAIYRRVEQAEGRD